MEKLDVGKFKDLLLKNQAELEGNLRHRDGITIQRAADLLEEVQLANDRELAVRSRDLESTLLRQVRAALRRIRDGAYGTCLACGGPIPPKRLAALPWASHCVRCQEERDLDGTPGRPNSPGAAGPDGLLALAA